MGLSRRDQAGRYAIPPELAVDPHDEHVLAIGERLGAGHRERQVTAFVAAEPLAVEPYLRRVADGAESQGGLLAGQRRCLEAPLVPGRAELVPGARQLVIP